VGNSAFENSAFHYSTELTCQV